MSNYVEYRSNVSNVQCCDFGFEFVICHNFGDWFDDWDEGYDLEDIYYNSLLNAQEAMKPTVHEETHIGRRVKHRRLREKHETKATTTRISKGWKKRNDKGQKKWSEQKKWSDLIE